ncbi:MAG: YtxH domain-containing protein [Candidatus Aminicenantes bacterium]|nr:YtxH domain-containing protein [Candidatus Aminicenantes bacterium]
MSEERGGLAGLVTFITGIAIGAGLALLYAPQTGEETRKKIKNGYDKVSDDVKENYDKFSKEAQKGIEAIKATSDKAVAQIKNFMDGEKEEMKKEIKEELAAPAKKKPAKV